MFKKRNTYQISIDEGGIKKLVLFLILFGIAFFHIESFITIALYSGFTTDSYGAFVLDFLKNFFGAGFGFSEMEFHQDSIYCAIFYGVCAVIEILIVYIKDKRRDDIKTYLFWCLSVIFFAITSATDIWFPEMTDLFSIMDKLCDIFGNLYESKIPNKTLFKIRKRNKKCKKYFKKHYKKQKCFVTILIVITFFYERENKTIVFRRWFLCCNNLCFISLLKS